jgi:stage III sporulation protein AG
MKKSGKLAVALLAAILGVSLLLWGKRQEGQDTPTPPAADTAARSPEAYREELESRMESICARVAGVGRVEVAVTLEGSFTYVYATEKKTAAGGETVTYVTVGSGSGETPVYLSEQAPAIRGIGVVCEGGMDPTVRREVTALLSAAFGVGSNKIYVTGGG